MLRAVNCEESQRSRAEFQPRVRAGAAIAAERGRLRRDAVAVAYPARRTGGPRWQREREGRTAARAPARKTVAADRDAQGPVDAHRRRDAAQLGRLAGPHFLGNIVHHAVLDPRDGKTLLAAARTGHLGPTVFRSTDRGRTWKEAATPPAFEPGSGRTVDHTFWLTPGHASEPGVWYAGTSPQGLFRSDRWRRDLVGRRRLQRASRTARRGAAATRTARRTGRSCIRSRSIRAIRSTCISACRAAASSNRPTRGADWRPLNHGVRADFLPDPNAEFGHDPHCLRLHPLLPDRLYHQNHMRHLPARSSCRPLDRHRRIDAEVGGLDRLSDGAASARPRHAVGISDGRDERVAARFARRQAGRVSLASTAAGPGSGRRPDCRSRRRGGRSSGRR